jgi:ribonuclease HII
MPPLTCWNTERIRPHPPTPPHTAPRFALKASQPARPAAQVYIDTVGDAERYAAKLSGVFPGLKFTVCPKADALYPIVSAASIVAKVTRDTWIQRAQARLFPNGDGKLGSGYPGQQASCVPLL